MRFLDKKSQKSKDVLLSIQNMAKWLNLVTIAEGVETLEQVEYLLTIGCRLAQGYYYYKPMDVESFNELLKEKDKIDHITMNSIKTANTNMFNVKELFYENMASNDLLNNVLGCISLIYKDNDKLYFEKGNEKLLDLLKIYDYNIIDKEVRKLFSLSKKDYDNMLQVLEDAQATDDESVEVIVNSVIDNQAHWLKFKFFFLSRVNDKEMYYAAISDISEDMKLVDELLISEQRFMTAMELTNILIFELDIQSRTVRYAKHTQGAFALEKDFTIAPEGFIEQGTVCDDSVEDFNMMYQEIFDGADESVRVIHAKMNGQEVYNRITMKAIKNSESESVKAIGTIINVTNEIITQKLS